MTRKILSAILLVAAATGVRAATVDVLWWTYAHPLSHYRAETGIPGIAANADKWPEGSGLSWNLTLWDADDETPDFSAYDVLVTHSGEAFRTNAPGQPHETPDYSGILSNKSAITAARGDRTIISATDADFHAIRGDTGLCEPFSGCGLWDGAIGYLINMVNWAASGQGLGIVALLDGEFPPLSERWWQQEDSFLHDELFGKVSYFRDNSPVIPTEAAAYPLNAGLTSLGLSEWRNSFHAGFDEIPGYSGTVFSSSRPGVPVTIATTAWIEAPTTPVPLPAAILHLGGALLMLAARRRRRGTGSC